MRLTYPITQDYRKHWDEWCAIRELYQEVLDQNQFPVVRREDGYFSIKDSGTGFKKEHLLLGKHDKASDSRGQFGEGVKIAAVVLSRLGYRLEILSPYLRAVTSLDTLFGEQIIALEVDESPATKKGTEFRIHGYQGSDFLDRILNSQQDGRILYNIDTPYQINPKYKTQILKMGNAIFIKDIYVGHFGYHFGYNTPSLKLEESRSLVSEHSLANEVSSIWPSVNDSSLVAELYDSLYKNSGFECRIEMTWRQPYHKEPWVEAWKEKFGDSHLSTSLVLTAEAAYKGAIIKYLPLSWVPFLEKAGVPTDISFLRNIDSQEILTIKEGNLTVMAKNNLSILQKILDRYYAGWSVRFAILPVNINGEAHLGKKLVYINSSNMENRPLNLISTFIHETAHIGGAMDNTISFQDALSSNAAGWIYSKTITEDLQKLK